MKDREIQNMIVVGSGHVAWHLINSFGSKGIHIKQILVRNEQTARKLSDTYSIPYTTEPALMDRNADLYLLAVQDDNIQNTAKALGLTDQLLVHTSGFSTIDILEGSSSNTGVFWPLQTLTSGKETDYRQVSIFIEGNTSENATRLKRFASLISDRVTVTDSMTRQEIHLAAVIASNLTNQLYFIAAAILDRHNISFDVLAPLILATAEKASQKHPFKSQTGPAVRHDLRVIEKHLELLRYDPAARDIYRLITDNIIHHHLKINE
jgi:predicted short-subunit dehydrogenase-like oxidoreductase (DUF2520 family)